jgi:uncharacterized protein YbjT (DUF2867 family)
VAPTDFSGAIHSVVHCAPSDPADIRARAIAAGAAQFVLISSMAAHAAATSQYGRDKWQFERACQSATDLIVRPGTVIGDGGIVRQLQRTLMEHRVIPLPFADQPLPFIAIGDLSRAIVRAVDQRLYGSLVLAHPKPITLRAMCRALVPPGSRAPLLVAVPGPLAVAGAVVLEAMGVTLPIAADRLRSLQRVHLMDPQSDLDRVGVRPVDLAEAVRYLG